MRPPHNQHGLTGRAAPVDEEDRSQTQSKCPKCLGMFPTVLLITTQIKFASQHSAQPIASDVSLQKFTYLNNEAAFRWDLNEDAMATEKLAEGICNFAKDGPKLRSELKKRLMNV
ncbi:hypothetical protein BC938DRAFT_471530 [Jimgerdemannia flammicorona]|uniref:Uncharacterized protein n=1 Tax=Jimgerdemannia flammicorona TaxID=994334 RepID=A0A433Q7X2_9FUNG|nr:hypothetical protein BC938DRAFT_471530 [Jimgerdemannia flammicorona]